MNFTMYPYGNANQVQIGSSWVFTCQHGKNECIGNMYEACAIEHNPGVSTTGVPNWWPFVNCMESSTDPVGAAQGCATTARVSWTDITTCAGPDPSQGSATDGNPLMHSIGLATSNLVPAHQFTPWVVLNGKPLTSAQLDLTLVSLVCKAYTGTKPAGC